MRTQADRDFDLNSGREIERKDAEIDRLRVALMAVRHDKWVSQYINAEMRALIDAALRRS